MELGITSRKIEQYYRFRAHVRSLGFIDHNEASELVENVEWTVTDGEGQPLQYVLKNQLAVLSILANNNWERPVYFAVTTGGDAYIGLQDYFRLEGLAYRLVPIKYDQNPNPNMLGGIHTDIMYDNVMDMWAVSYTHLTLPTILLV